MASCNKITVSFASSSPWMLSPFRPKVPTVNRNNQISPFSKNSFLLTSNEKLYRDYAIPLPLPSSYSRLSSSLQGVLLENDVSTLSDFTPSNYDTPIMAASLLTSSLSPQSSLSSIVTLNSLSKDIEAWLNFKPDETTDLFTDNSVPQTTVFNYGKSHEISTIESSGIFLSADTPPQSPSITDTTITSRPPTKEEIQLLRNAFAAFYGTDSNAEKAAELFGRTIDTWEASRQPLDETAGLYRVRGDIFVELGKPSDAIKDYAMAIKYLEGPGGENADPTELPTSHLGRARAIRSLGSSASKSEATDASQDYQVYFRYTSRIDADDDDDESSSNTSTNNKYENNKAITSDVIIDGIQRNPYAAWEWGMVERVAGNFNDAAEIHRLAGKAFEEVGDKPRSIICMLDRGIDLASLSSSFSPSSSAAATTATKEAKEALEAAIDSTTSAEGRDVELLQRVVAKEGEARVALAGVLWNSSSSKDKALAETQFGEACGRLDELNADYQSREQERTKKSKMTNKMSSSSKRVGFSIDDIVGAEEASCSRFKNEKFLEEKLVWPPTLQNQVKKFLTLAR